MRFYHNYNDVVKLLLSAVLSSTVIAVYHANVTSFLCYRFKQKVIVIDVCLNCIVLHTKIEFHRIT